MVYLGYIVLSDDLAQGADAFFNEEEYEEELLEEVTFKESLASLNDIVTLCLSKKDDSMRYSYDPFINLKSYQKEYGYDIAMEYSSLLSSLLWELDYYDLLSKEDRFIAIETSEIDIVRIKFPTYCLGSVIQLQNSYADVNTFSLNQAKFLAPSYSNGIATISLKFEDYLGEYSGLSEFLDMYVD